MLLIILDGDIYDVEKYQIEHPGEGINSIYLRNFNRKDCTSLFDKYHNINKPYEILKNAKEKGNYNKVRYICPNFFGKRIPKNFYFLDNDPYALNLMKDKQDNYYILRRNDSNIENSIYITYKQNEQIFHLKVMKTSDKWFYENNNKKTYGNNIKEIVETFLSQFNLISS